MKRTDVLRSLVWAGVAAVGVAFGYRIGTERAKACVVDVAQDATRKVRKSIADLGESAEVRALRSRVATLKRALAEARAGREEAVSNALAKANAGHGPGWRHNPRERLEALKKSDPARYAEVTNRMAKFVARRRDDQRARSAFLASIDTSHMSASARETHDALLEALQRKAELESRLHEEGLDDGSRHALMREIFQIDRECRRLGSDERSNLLAEAVQAVGLEGEAAQALVDTVGDVIEATESGRGMPPGPPGPPPAADGAR